MVKLYHFFYREYTHPTNLTLSEPVKKEVSDQYYRQYLKLHGQPVLIRIPDFYRDNGLKLLCKGEFTSMLLPLDDGTKSTLSRIESFVKSNVVSQTYKPLWLKDAMYVNISKWCRFETVHFNGTRTLLPQGTVLGKGTYSVTLQVSHVYVRPHKGGETCKCPMSMSDLTKEGRRSLFLSI